MQNRKSFIRVPNPNFISYIHPRTLAPNWTLCCYATHISCCKGSKRIKTQIEKEIAFYARGERKRLLLWKKERKIERQRQRQRKKERKKDRETETETEKVSQPYFGQVWGETQHLESWDLESSGTPECSELDSRTQNTSHWGVLGVIGKVLKRGYRKCPRIGHLDICRPSYGQKKGRESNWQFDSRPLKVGNWPLPDVRFECATWRWEDLDEGYKFGWDLVAIKLCSRELWRVKVLGVLVGQFRDSISGVSRICAIWMRPPRGVAEYTIGSKVVAYSRARAVVSLVVRSARGKSQHPRVSRMLN